MAKPERVLWDAFIHVEEARHLLRSLKLTKAVYLAGLLEARILELRARLLEEIPLSDLEQASNPLDESVH